MTARVESTATRSAPSAAPDGGNRVLATSAAVMASGTFVSRVLGLLRNALLVAVVGATAGVADSWSVANKLPNIISMLLAGGILNAVLVPQVVRAMKRRDGGQDYVNRLLTAAIAVLAGLTLLLTAAASVLVTVYSANGHPEWKAVTVALAYWCIPQLFFYGLYTLLGQVLNARSIFGPYMWAPVINNVVAIAGLVAFLVIFGALPRGGIPAAEWTGDRITLLAGTATLGVIAQALVLIVPLYRSGFRFRPTWGLRGHGLGKASTIATWAFAALAVGQLGYLAVSNLAASASSAGVSDDAVYAGNFAYDNAFLVFMLPQSLVTVSLVTALFTRVAHNAAIRDGVKVRDDLSLGLRTLGIFTVLATAGFAVLAIPLVQLVTLDRASNGFEDYRAIGAVLVAMSFGLVAIAVWTMVQRIFYAYEDTRTLFRIQVPMAAILVIGCVLSWWLLEPQWWVAGAGVATTLSNTVGATVGYLATRKYLPNLDGARVLRTYLRVVLAVLPPALVVWGLLHLWGVQTGFVGALLRVLVLGTVLVIGYVALLRVLRVSELDGLAARVRGPVDRLLRRGRGSAAPTPPRTMAASGGNAGRGAADVSADPSVVLRAGDLVADRFRLDDELATSAPGTSTWLGTDVALDTPVRVLLVEDAVRDHVVDAARRAALIEDPRIPRVLRAGVEGSNGFVVTQTAPSVSLADLARRGPLAPSQARALIGEAAAALEVARRRGVHHLTLHPDSLLRTDEGTVLLVGLGTESALRGTDRRDSKAAGRADAVGLVQLLYTALTGTWPGDPALADGLPLAATEDDVTIPAGDVATVPNDLDTLCAVTLGQHDDGPFTPGELVADLAPWGAIDVDVTSTSLPPVVRPNGALPPIAGAIGVVPGALAGDETGAIPAVDDAAPVTGIDTSGWAPHPLPAASEPTPFADLVTDTGTIPAQRAPHHATQALQHGSQRLDVTLPAEADGRVGTVAAGAGAAGVAGAVAAGGAVAAAATGASGAASAAIDSDEPDVAAPAEPSAAVEGADANDGDSEPAIDSADETNADASRSDKAQEGAATGSEVADEATAEGAVTGDEPAVADDDLGDETTETHDPDGAESESTGTEVAAQHPDVESGADAHPEVAGAPGDPTAITPLLAAAPVAGLPGATSAVEPDESAINEPAPVIQHEARTSVGGYPTLSREPRGWDLPGGAAPELLPVEPVEPTVTPSGAMRTGIEHAGPHGTTADVVAAREQATATGAAAGAAGSAAALGKIAGGAATGISSAARAVGGAASSVGARVSAATSGVRGTNRRINDVSERVGGGAKRLVTGAGERLGSISGRAGTFVQDVREEFEPVDDDGEGRPRFNPAPFVLAAMIALVIFAAVMALLTLRDASTAFTPGPNPGEVPPSATEAPATSPATTAPPAEESTDENAVPAASRVDIESATTFDPTAAGGENQDQAYLAFDGRDDTTWNSLRYNSPTYGMKDGLGFTITLEETALVSSVTLDVRGEGGQVEIRAGDDPESGTVLASGAMGSSVTYTFSEPVEADAISLWFPELPVADSDGRNRIELAEITLG